MKRLARKSFTIPSDENILSYRKSLFEDEKLQKYKVLTNKAIYQYGIRIDISNLTFNGVKGKSSDDVIQATIHRDVPELKTNYKSGPFNLYWIGKFCSVVVPYESINHTLYLDQKSGYLKKKKFEIETEHSNQNDSTYYKFLQKFQDNEMYEKPVHRIWEEKEIFCLEEDKVIYKGVVNRYELFPPKFYRIILNWDANFSVGSIYDDLPVDRFTSFLFEYLHNRHNLPTHR